MITVKPDLLLKSLAFYQRYNKSYGYSIQLITEMIKLINSLMKKFLRPKETRTTATATPTPTFEICQFVINNRLGHFDQLTIMIEII